MGLNRTDMIKYLEREFKLHREWDASVYEEYWDEYDDREYERYVKETTIVVLIDRWPYMIEQGGDFWVLKDVEMPLFYGYRTKYDSILLDADRICGWEKQSRFLDNILQKQPEEKQLNLWEKETVKES